MTATPAVRQRVSGTPSKLTDETATSIIESVSVGLTWAQAAIWAGVHRATLVEWRKRGQEAWAQVAKAVEAMSPEELDALEAHDDTRDPASPYGFTDRDIALEHYCDPVLVPFLRLWRNIERAQVAFERRGIATMQEFGRGFVEEESQTVTELDEKGKVVKTVTTTRRKPVRSWQAHAWLLERRIPERYSQLSRHEHSGIGGEAIELEVVQTPEQRLLGMSDVDRDARTAEILRIMADAELLDAEVVDDLLVPPGSNGESADGAVRELLDPEDDGDVHPDRPDA